MWNGPTIACHVAFYSNQMPTHCMTNCFPRVSVSEPNTCSFLAIFHCIQPIYIIYIHILHTYILYMFSIQNICMYVVGAISGGFKNWKSSICVAQCYR